MRNRYENNSPAVRFLDRGKQLARLQGRVIQQIIAATTAEHHVIKATMITEATDAKEFVRETMSRLDNSKERFADIDLMFQLFFCRHVDNFQIFIEELIGDAVRQDPTLVAGIHLRKADHNLPPEEKLRKRMRKLSFMGFSDLVETLQTEMSFSLFTSGSSASRVAYLFDLRNLITHSYGTVDEHFFAKHGGTADLAIGKPIGLDPQFIHNAFTDLAATAADIQRRAQDRFRLFYKTTVREAKWWER